MIFAAAAIVTAEVLLRKGLGAVFGTGFVFSGSDEISSFLFAVGTSWSLAHVLVTRGHVRIDALYTFFGPRLRVILDLFALLVLGVFVAALLERSWDVASTSYIDEIRSNSPQRLPLAWAQVPWFAGIALFFLALVLAFLRSAWRFCAATTRAQRRSPALPPRTRRSKASSRASAFRAKQARGQGTGDDRNHAPAADPPARAQRPVAAVMGVLGLALNQFYASMPLHRAMGEIIWNTSSEYILIAIPLFVMLGEILLRAGIAERVYNAIAQWLSWLPGGLMHANIGACAMFAATSGSSVATAATIGTVALPEIQKRKYDEPLFLGTIAAGGTLGILIPPSINFIFYGLLTNSSVPRLYLAGFIPGFALAFFFMVHCIRGLHYTTAARAAYP